MAKDPAILFYTSDFLSSTQGLTLEERGALITLICLQHQTGHLSEKSIKIAVGEISEDVRSYFKQDEKGLLFNERIDIEKERRTKYAESRRKNRLNKSISEGQSKSYDDTYDDTYVQHMETETETETINVNENVDEIKDENKIEDRNKYGEFKNVILSDKEYEALKKKYPYTYETQIDNLSYYIKSKGDKYASHYATILSWERREKETQGYSSFDTDEFFQAALERSKRRIAERSQAKNGREDPSPTYLLRKNE